MSEEFRVFLSTIYGEAAASTPAAWRAIASVIMNRVGVREWKRLKTPLRVIALSGFDAFTQRNRPYMSAWNYYSGGRQVLNMWLERLEEEVYPIYSREDAPTTDAQLYYSPAAQAALAKAKPEMYRTLPRWNFDVLEEVKVPGTEADDFRFFRYQVRVSA